MGILKFAEKTTKSLYVLTAAQPENIVVMGAAMENADPVSPQSEAGFCRSIKAEDHGGRLGQGKAINQVSMRRTP